MKSSVFQGKIAALMVGALFLFTACKKETAETDPTEESNDNFRGVTIKYSALTSSTPYNNDLFKDKNGDSTINRTEGWNRLRMLKAIDAYGKTANNGTAVDYTTLVNMFNNSNSPFTGSYVDLNSVSEQLRDVTATSKSAGLRDDVIDDFYAYFQALATASLSGIPAGGDTATSGNAGRLYAPLPSTSKYLVDAKGIEQIQVISKSFIGAFQLDYIGNVLLGTGLEADNSQLVEGQKYTELEHNWDLAYAHFSLFDKYAATDAGNGGESFLAAYVWEYNKTGFPQVHPAFLKGRAAIINNDMATVREQAEILRNIFEIAIANAAVGYMGKWVSGTSNASRAHAIGEGLGFIYSMRFCYLNGADETFSDAQIDALDIYEGNGFWDLTAPKVNGVSAAIQTKFGL